MQLDDFYVSEWGFIDADPTEESSPNWIVFLNETIYEGLKFQLSPNITEIDTRHELFIELTDHNSEPESKIYEFAFSIIDQNVEFEKIVSIVT